MATRQLGSCVEDQEHRVSGANAALEEPRADLSGASPELSQRDPALLAVPAQEDQTLEVGELPDQAFHPAEQGRCALEHLHRRPAGSEGRGTQTIHGVRL